MTKSVDQSPLFRVCQEVVRLIPDRRSSVQMTITRVQNQLHKTSSEYMHKKLYRQPVAETWRRYKELRQKLVDAYYARNIYDDAYNFARLNNLEKLLATLESLRKGRNRIERIDAGVFTRQELGTWIRLLRNEISKQQKSQAQNKRS